MSYGLVQDVPASWQDYERLSVGVVEPPPIGLIVHLAGPTDEGIRVIEVWDSDRDWESFQTERLAPVVAALAATSRQQPRIRDLHALQIVLGANRLKGE
jgi:hypothetical protein